MFVGRPLVMQRWSGKKWVHLDQAQQWFRNGSWTKEVHVRGHELLALGALLPTPLLLRPTARFVKVVVK